jgi:hypothetical protein
MGPEFGALHPFERLNGACQAGQRENLPAWKAGGPDKTHCKPFWQASPSRAYGDGEGTLAGGGSLRMNTLGWDRDLNLFQFRGLRDGNE